jgi:hypothetical protein
MKFSISFEKNKIKRILLIRIVKNYIFVHGSIKVKKPCLHNYPVSYGLVIFRREGLIVCIKKIFKYIIKVLKETEIMTEKHLL